MKIKTTSASYGMMPHQQQKKLVRREREYESSSSSSSSSSSLTCILDSQASPTTAIHTNNLCYLNHKPPYHHVLTEIFDYRVRKLKHFCSSHVHHGAWERLKSLCLHSLPIMDVLPLPESKKNKLTGMQKREELEREVTVLNKMLAHEQKVREYLEHFDHRQDNSALTIPNFLPPKMKEILAELAMVEDEITRLESLIKNLQGEVKKEKEANMERKYEEWGRVRETLQNHHPPPPHPNSRRTNEKASFDTKALHFINKAIKGDYHLPNFINDKSKSLNEGGGEAFREKLSKRSGQIKHPSPLREPRNPTPRRDRYLDVPSDYTSKVMSTPLHTEEENIQRWPPNKLSENIMKCLVFIYVRLLRTSRAMEMEKSGSIARSTNFSMSFRAESSSNSKNSLMQQDPYGIFDAEASISRDIGPYKNLVRFTSKSMDLKCIQNSNSVPLFQRLKVLMDGLQKVDLRFLSHQQKLAFWINMYNACIMHGYLQYGVPAVLNHDTLLALITKATLNVAGNTINARAIEHFILRNPEDSLLKEIHGKEKGSKEMVVGDLYGLKTPDPNIIFALCCGTRSSPAVKIYTAEGVGAELERSKLEYLQAAIMVSAAKKIALPELVVRNMKADKESMMEWVCQQLPTSGSLRKSIVDCFRSGHGGKGGAVVEKIPYEFEFQYLLAI